MSIRNMMIRWYGSDNKFIPAVSRLYVLMIGDIAQWIKNGHSIKKYITIHFPNHFNDIYEHDATSLRENLRSALSSQLPFIEDKKIIDRLINMLDKIFSDICRGDLTKSIKANEEYWIYFERIINPQFRTVVKESHSKSRESRESHKSRKSK
jgi:hypothetical protein